MHMAQQNVQQSAADKMYRYLDDQAHYEKESITKKHKISTNSQQLKPPVTVFV